MLSEDKVSKNHILTNTLMFISFLYVVYLVLALRKKGHIDCMGTGFSNSPSLHGRNTLLNLHKDIL